MISSRNVDFVLCGVRPAEVGLEPLPCTWEVLLTLGRLITELAGPGPGSHESRLFRILNPGRRSLSRQS